VGVGVGEPGVEVVVYEGAGGEVGAGREVGAG